MRAYRDIPVPSWKVIFPDKLLQFRPLDGLRSDLITLSGIQCVLSQQPLPKPRLILLRNLCMPATFRCTCPDASVQLLDSHNACAGPVPDPAV